MKSEILVCVALVLLLLPSYITIPNMVVAQAPTIYVDPSIVTVKAFDSFAVGINVGGH